MSEPMSAMWSFVFGLVAIIGGLALIAACGAFAYSIGVTRPRIEWFALGCLSAAVIVLAVFLMLVEREVIK